MATLKTHNDHAYMYMYILRIILIMQLLIFSFLRRMRILFHN